MASEFAPPPQQLQPHDDATTTFPQPSSSSFEEPIVNGDHAPTEELDVTSDAKLVASQDHLPADTESSLPDPNPTSLAPVENVTPGMAPVADFLPKDGANLSHPTPPPDEPLTTGSADVDVEMENDDSTPQPVIESALSPLPEPVSAVSEQSLVRPREDDGEDEPAAKRSKTEDEPSVVVQQTEVALPDSTVVVEATETDAHAPAILETIAAPVVDPVVEPVIETPVVEAVVEEIGEAVPAMSVPPESVEAIKAEAMQVDDQPPESVESPDVIPPVTETSVELKAEETPVVTDTALPAEAAPAAAEPPKYSTEPMTTTQKSSLVEKMKNLKKTKNSVAFLKPVDYVALNIPTYPEIVKNPMDLSTLESKLKEGKYVSIQDFADDFDLIIGNVRRFNGDAHPVTQAGFAMEAYFRRMMETVPRTDQKEPPKVEKNRSPSLPREKSRRESSRVVPTAAPAAAAPAATAETYALHADGTPQIRRQSSINSRPARAIKPPQNREIPYAKPKRKENQLELRFCEHVLDELRSSKYGTTNHVFLYPVDPVALNIPHYRQIVKHPMDMSTMQQKLKGGQYATAAEFKKDFNQMIENCLTFNPTGNPVRDIGVQFQRQFQELWGSKEKWERQHQPASNRASSASGDEDSSADEEDEDTKPTLDVEAQQETIMALQRQLTQLQSSLSAYKQGGKPSGGKKSKSGKSGGSKKKAASIPAVPAKKAAAKPPSKSNKKQKQVTYEEKQEISEAVGRMNEGQVNRLTEIITQNCAKYRDMEEMELEIDDLPNDVQLMLLQYVRSIFPRAKKAREPSPDDAAALDDDDYEERGGRAGGAGGPKRKKHRPMNSQQQQDQINSLKNKLAQFNQAATSGSESPTNSSFNAAAANADTSGDEESEESEEE